jgi:aminoglycoside phosphotransferase family enzyme
MQTASAALVEALHNPTCYDHQVDRVKLIETHISWVFLAGKFAYKLKKPLNFGFLDFSTLKKRQHYCQEELRLNQRFAPQLYLDVIPVGGDLQKPQIGAEPAIDYLVKMKRFSRRDELDFHLQENSLSVDMIEQFADYLADLHQRAPFVDPRSYFGSLDSVQDPVAENFEQLRPLLAEPACQKQLSALENWAQAKFEQLRYLFKERKERGFIRECHGDVHLANMLWYEGQPLLFDCIEFNDNFRCIDLVNDYAFLLMDLDDHGAEMHSWSFLNRYLRETGDYAALPLLNYYKSYRALVRAKVIGLRLQQPGLSKEERNFDIGLLESYLHLAEVYSQPQQPRLIITHGFSGSGKTSFLKQLCPLLGAISLHSDVERKRLFNLSATASSASQLDDGIYKQSATERCYQQLRCLAEQVLKAGFTAIVDATFLQHLQRQQFQQLAEHRQVPLSILDFPVSESELLQRIKKRASEADSISEATPAVLKKQQQQADPLTLKEQQLCIRVTEQSTARQIAEQLGK